MICKESNNDLIIILSSLSKYGTQKIQVKSLQVWAVQSREH